MPIDPETAPILLDTGAVIAHMAGHVKISKRIPTNDIWIAATAAEYGLPLMATDAHFKRIDDLELILFDP